MKIVLIIFGIIIVCLYIAPLISSHLNIGNIFGICLGTIIFLFGLLYNSILTIKTNALFLIFTAFFLTFMLVHIITLMLVIFNTRKSASKEEIVIVLGCRVKGNMPSRALYQRCLATYNYLSKNEKAIAILSGGQGVDEKISEAQCMYNTLTELGIKSNRLIIEDKSTSTKENIIFSKKFIDNKSLDNIAIVSSEYHLLRAKLIAKQQGLKVKVIPAKSLRFLRVPYFSREVFGIWKLILEELLEK